MIDVERSQPAPASLASGSWNQDDVLLALQRDFLGKCYLCESPTPLRAAEVDHLIPRGVDPGLALSWSNLMLCCGNCNRRRPKYKAVTDLALLDPCAGTEVATRLSQRYDPLADLGERCHFEARAADDRAAVNSAAELMWIHSLPRGSGQRVRVRELLEDIERVHGHVADCLEQARSSARAGDAETAAEQLGRARSGLARAAPFHALLASALGDLLARVEAFVEAGASDVS